MKRSYFTGRRVKSGPTVLKKKKPPSVFTRLEYRNENGWKNTECRFRNHPLPRLLLRFLARPDRLEHFLFTDPSHFGQGNGIFRCFLRSLVFDGAGKCFCILRVVAVEEVLWQGGGGFLSIGGFDVALFGLFDSFFHLDLFVSAGLLVPVVA